MESKAPVSSDMYTYGQVGTTRTIKAGISTGHALLAEGWVKMEIENAPSDGKLYVVHETGTWEICTDNEMIRAYREELILATWPVSKQFEALTDAAAGRPEKLSELQSFLEAVKTNNPYIPTLRCEPDAKN